VILWFRNRKKVYLELCRYWSSPEFKVKFEKKRQNHGKDPKHRYDADGNICNCKSQCIVRFHCSGAIFFYVVM
jgi:hypothetical protein